MKLNEIYKLGFFVLLSMLVTFIGVITRKELIEMDIAMLFIVINILCGSILKPTHAYAVCILNIMVFHYFILPDFYSFKFQDTQYLVTYVVLAGSGIFAVRLTQSQRAQIDKNQRLTRQLNTHYQLARRLSANVTPEQIAWEATRYLYKTHGVPCALFAKQKHWQCLAKSAGFTNELVSKCKEHLPPSSIHYISLKNGDREVGVLALKQDQQQGVNAWFLSLITMSLARANAMLALSEAEASNQVEKIRTTLLASVSHDLKTPLGTIIGTATTLCDKEANIEAEVREELLRTVVAEGERLHQSLNKLLDITRFTSGTFSLQLDWVEPEELIGSALQRLKPYTGQHQIQLKGDPMLVELDGLLIEQVISNLVENSVKYSPKSTEVLIKYQYQRDEFHLSIENLGPHIPENELTKIFERFYRLDNNQVEGTGLGLAICNVITSAHGGTITATNLPTIGVRFDVRIPCRTLDLEDWMINE